MCIILTDKKQIKWIAPFHENINNKKIMDIPTSLLARVWKSRKKEDVTQLHNLYSTRNSLTMPKNMRYYWLVSKRNNTRKILHPDIKEMSLLKYFRRVHFKINPALKLDPDDKILELSPNYSNYSLLIQIICLKRLWFSRYRAVTYLCSRSDVSIRHLTSLNIDYYKERCRNLQPSSESTVTR